MNKDTILIFLILICKINFASAVNIIEIPSDDTLDFNSSTEQAIVIDYNTNEILFQKNIHDKIHPASMTKIMTAYIAFDTILNKTYKDNFFLDTKCKISAKAYKMGGSRTFLELDSYVSVIDLIKGTIVQSGNDSAVALAECIAGSEKNFTILMNEYSQNLGLKNTNFTNSTGWPNAQHYSTVYDIAILSNNLIKNFPELYKYFSIKEFTYNDISQPNRNKLLQSLDGADGLKTGFTKESGWGMAASTLRNNKRITTVVSGANSSRSRLNDVTELTNLVYLNDKINTKIVKQKDVKYCQPMNGEEFLICALNQYKLGEVTRSDYLKILRDKFDKDPMTKLYFGNSAYLNKSVSIEDLFTMYQSINFTSKELNNPEETVKKLKSDELKMAFYFQLSTIQIFPVERAEVLAKFFKFASSINLEKIAYDISSNMLNSIDFYNYKDLEADVIEEIILALNYLGKDEFIPEIYKRKNSKKEIAVLEKPKKKEKSKIITIEEEYYNNNKNLFIYPEERSFKQFNFRTKEDANNFKIIISTKSIEDIAKYAKENNIIYNEFKNLDRSKVLEQLANSIFTLNEGKVSDVIKTSLAYHVIVLDEIFPERQLAFNEVKDDIRKLLNKNKKEILNQDTINEDKQNLVVENDNEGPRITIANTFEGDEDFTASIKGKITDQSEIVSVTVDGDEVALSQGSFNKDLFVRPNGQSVQIIARDKHGNKSETTVQLIRSEIVVTKDTFDFLDPRKIKVETNQNAVALIIGVEEYETISPALFAKNDALVFNDFARMTLGVPQSNIKLLTNDDAGRNDTIKVLKTWLPKKIIENKTDLFIFYSGHGLATDDGSDLYLLPSDGDPDILEDTSILRNSIFDIITNLNPKTVTMFLDTCYSGTTRSEEFLIAAKPILVEPEEQEIPINFNIFSAASGKQTAKVLEEAEHGLFSYFMMKGLEGEADSNNDRTITNGELHAFINKNVSRQANQTPQLNGDPEQVLVQW